MSSKQNKYGKEFIKANGIKCQWCEERLAYCNAHIMSKHLSKAMPMVKTMLPKTERDQKNPNMAVGITCPVCDPEMGLKWEDDEEMIVPITLWKIAAFESFVQKHDKECKYSIDEMVFQAKCDPPTEEELKFVKDKMRGFLENKCKPNFYKLNIIEEGRKLKNYGPESMLKPFYILGAVSFGWGFHESEKVETRNKDNVHTITIGNFSPRYFFYDFEGVRYYTPAGNYKISKKDIIKDICADYLFGPSTEWKYRKEDTI